MSRSVAEQVRRRILKQGEGSVFLVRDFLDLGNQETITRTLSRLATEGLIRRVQQGVYDYPRMSRLLGKTAAPDIARVAEALARRTGNKIAPSEASIANGLGLTTQVPAKSIYLTNGGKKRRVQVGGQTIELRPVAARYFPHSRGESVILGLQWVGEGNITDAMIEKVRAELDSGQKSALRRKLVDAPGWMQPVLRRIAERETEPVTTTGLEGSFPGQNETGRQTDCLVK